MENAKPSVPFVYWAQSEDEIFLRVELEAKAKPQINTTKTDLDFSCDGTAPTKGRRNFAFHVEFFDEIVPGDEGCRAEVRGNNIQLFVKKAKDKQYFWDRLLKDRAKLAWLKIDFDRFQSGEAESEEEKPDDPDRDPRMKNTVDELLKGIKKPGFTQPGMDFKKMYLTAYNTFMFLGFFGIFVSLVRNFVSHGTDFIPRTFNVVGLNVQIMQLAMLLEIFHSLIGLVKTSPIPTAGQTLGRLIIVYLIINEPYLQTISAVFYMFVAWATIELIRYPFYLCQIHDTVVKPLKVLRYTSWMVLYPVGMLMETVILVKALETYPLSHPTPIFIIGDKEITISHFIGLYLISFPVGCVFMLRYMFKQTQKQIFSKKSKTVKEKSR